MRPFFVAVMPALLEPLCCYNGLLYFSAVVPELLC